MNDSGFDFFDMMEALTAQHKVAEAVDKLPLHSFLSVIEGTISAYADIHGYDPIELGYDIADTISEVETE